MDNVTTASRMQDTFVSPAFEVRGVDRSFGIARVLCDVSLVLYPGEVHALVGENGAGKSTLIKVLTGVYTPDRGHIEIDGREVHLRSPGDAQGRGITAIYQEPTLFPDLSVAENVFIGRQPRPKARPWLDRRKMRADTRALLGEVGSLIPPGRLARGLSLAEMQLVEISAAMSKDTRLLIVDEPTASLTPAEVERLFMLLRKLCSTGVSVLFIGHRLEEIYEIAQRVTVLRDGAVIVSCLLGEITEAGLIEAMVGRPGEARLTRRRASRADDVMLKIEKLGRRGLFQDISFTVHAGEVVGMAGLVGAGRSEIARAAFGIDRYDTGQVMMQGRRLPPGRPDLAVEAGVAYVPEDRKAQSLADCLPVYQNISILLIRGLMKFGLVKRRQEQTIAARLFREFGVKAQSLTQSVGELSGGNQQKVVLAKWLALHPKVLILDEPTRGVDVAGKEEIHKLIDSLASEGLAILVISSDMPEILTLSDRVIVIREGRFAGELPADSSAAEVLGLSISRGKGAAGPEPLARTHHQHEHRREP
jgi:rhamnose transport system ATP-binding protein